MITPDEVLNFIWDGDAAIKDAVQRAWSRNLWKMDMRCHDFDPESSDVPILSAHVRVIEMNVEN